MVCDCGTAQWLVKHSELPLRNFALSCYNLKMVNQMLRGISILLMVSSSSGLLFISVGELEVHETFYFIFTFLERRMSHVESVHCSWDRVVRVKRNMLNCLRARTLGQLCYFRRVLA